MIIYGAEGSGKTCLLARAAQQCHIWQQQLDVECGLEMGVILRFARLTPESSSVLTMLHSLTQQVSLLAAGRLPRNPHVINPLSCRDFLDSLCYLYDLQTLSDYQSTLHRLLDDDRCLKKRFTFIIDGIDHLDDFESVIDLLAAWLSLQLPVNIKVLMTLRNGQHLERLNGLLPENAFYQVYRWEDDRNVQVSVIHNFILFLSWKSFLPAKRTICSTPVFCSTLTAPTVII